MCVCVGVGGNGLGRRRVALDNEIGKRIMYNENIE